MARDIVIIPNRDFTGSTTQPEIRFSGLTGASITLKVEDDGTIVFEGDTGGLFEINDSKDGLLNAVSDVSGLPIFSVYSDDRVVAGKWDDPGLTVSASTVFVGPTGATNSTLHVSGTTEFLSDTNIINDGKMLSAGTDLYSIFSTGGGADTNMANTDLLFTTNREHDLNSNELTFINGDIGIGLSSPSSKLHLKGDGNTSASSGLRVDNSDGVIWDFKDDKILYKEGNRFMYDSGFNIFIGRQAGNTSLTGNFLSAFGRNALTNVTTGSNNVGIGYAAGSQITTSSSNTFVGSSAGQLATGSTNTAFGYRAGYSLKGAGGNNVAVGNNCLQSTSNTAFGNTAVGSGAGSQVTSGYRNVLMGQNAGVNLSTGFSNIIIGYQAGTQVNTGNYNTIVGYEAHQDSNASFNTSVGTWSMRNVGVGANYSVAVGYQALQGDNANKLTGLYNTAIGYGSLSTVETTAERNVALGYNAGGSVGTGTNNVLLGFQAGTNFGDEISGGTHNILIGPDTRVTEDGQSNYLAIGKSSSPTITGDIDINQIGIGLSNGDQPNSTLQVAGSLSLWVMTASTTTTTGNEVFVGVTDTSSPRTVTIQTSDIKEGRIFIIKDQSGGAATNNITIATQGSQTIDGTSTITITANYGVGRLYVSNDGNLYTW